MRITENFVLFWESPLSNFYPYVNKSVKDDEVQPLNFTYDNLTWNTSEQLFMYQKALFFNDYNIAETIKNCLRPEDAKRLGRKIKNFDEDRWNKVSTEIMFQAVYAKFSQLESLRQYILQEKFNNKHFVEASPFDKIWGIGLHYNDKLCDNRDNWLGQNKLGQVLDNVRNKIKTSL